MTQLQLIEPEVQAGALFDDSRVHRYQLWRRWGAGRAVMFVCLNPSTADERVDDPTVRRCVRFTQAWGYGAMTMGNLYAYRASSPQALQHNPDAVGEENDAHLRLMAADAALVVAAWGVGGALDEAHTAHCTQLLLHAHDSGSGLRCLGKTRGGHPRHPLYLPGTAALEAWPG